MDRLQNSTKVRSIYSFYEYSKHFVQLAANCKQTFRDESLLIRLVVTSTGQFSAPRSWFLPRDAMPARNILSSCVYLSVCPSQAGIISKRLDKSSWFWVLRLPSTYPTSCYKEIWASPKLAFVPNSVFTDLENFSTASRSRFRRSSLLMTPIRQSTSRGCLLHVDQL